MSAHFECKLEELLMKFKEINYLGNALGSGYRRCYLAITIVKFPNLNIIPLSKQGAEHSPR